MPGQKPVSGWHKKYNNIPAFKYLFKVRNDNTRTNFLDIALSLLLILNRGLLNDTSLDLWFGTFCWLRTKTYPAGIYLFEVNNENIRIASKICSKLIIKRTRLTSVWWLPRLCYFWTDFKHCSGVSIVECGQVNTSWVKGIDCWSITWKKTKTMKFSPFLVWWILFCRHLRMDYIFLSILPSKIKNIVLHITWVNLITKYLFSVKFYAVICVTFI